MTFEEYKRRREKDEPRSWHATIIMGAVAIVALAFAGLNILAMLNVGFSIVNACALVFAIILGLYAAIVALEGKWKSAKEALFSFFMFWPLP